MFRPAHRPGPAGVDDAARRAWSRTVRRALAVPVLVLLPLLTVAPGSDNRFNIHRFGAEYATRPWLVVTDQLASIPDYLTRHGNFRPLGRMLERAFDVLTFTLSTAFDLPVNIAMRIVHLTAAALLCLMLLAVVATLTGHHPLRDRPPSAAVHLLPFAFGALLVAAGSTSTIVVFTDLYFASMTVVLGVALATARTRWLTTEGLTFSSAAAAVAVGAGMASFNEITALGVPLTFAVVLARGHLTMGLAWRTLVRSRAALATAVGTLGFAAVFVPVRIAIAANCADGSCYEASDISLDPAFVPAFGHRLLTWLPPLQWRVASAQADGHWYLTSNPVLALLLVAIGALAWRTASDLRRAPIPDGRQLLALGSVGATILLLGAVLAASSAFVQGLVGTWAIGTGWRDNQIVASGAALLLVAIVLAVARGSGARRADSGDVVAKERATAHRTIVAALTLFALVAGGSLLSNKTYAALDARRPEAALHKDIALALTSPADRADADARRCGLLQEFEALHPDESSWHRRLREATDMSTQTRFGIPFCREVTDL